MKNKFLISAISFLFFVFGAKAQNIIVSNSNGQVVNNDTLILSPGLIQKPPYSEIHCKLYPKNVSNNPLELLVKKTEHILSQNVTHSFCFIGHCFTPATFVSPNFSLLNAGQTDSSFKGVYIYDPVLHVPMIDFVSYTFYNNDNILDSAIVYVKYNTTSSLDLETTNNFTVQISPNPAISVINIESDQQLQKIELFDLFGRIIKSVSLLKNNTYTFDIENLICGQYVLKIYFKDGFSFARFCKK